MVTKTKNKVQKRAKKQEELMRKMGLEHRRNEALYDKWSVTHVIWAMLLAWVMSPLAALIIMILWEPLENLVISPFVAQYGIEFGYESLRNSLSDIVFDVVGVLLAIFVLSKLFDPPFYLF